MADQPETIMATQKMLYIRLQQIERKLDLILQALSIHDESNDEPAESLWKSTRPPKRVKTDHDQ